MWIVLIIVFEVTCCFGCTCDGFMAFGTAVACFVVEIKTKEIES